MINYTEQNEMKFQLEETEFAIYVNYEQVIKNNKTCFDVSIWLADDSKYNSGYKKYICGDYIEKTNKFLSVKKIIKNNINKMIENKVFDEHIKDYKKEIAKIGELYE